MTEDARSRADDALYGYSDAVSCRLSSNNTTQESAEPQPAVILPPPTNPMAVARELLAERRHENGALVLRHWRGSWMEWDGCAWREAEDRTVRSEMYRLVERARYRDNTPDGHGRLHDWAPNRHRMADLLDAISAVSHLPSAVHPPVWIDGATGPTQIVACRNGLLDVVQRRLLDHDPRYFTAVSVPFAFNPDATTPDRWLAFLAALWPDDEDAISALQEFFGYVLSGRTDLDRILLLVGPTRAGKGVIARVLGRLIGPANVAGPTLASLGQNFGLQDLIGKPLAVISDARLGRGDTTQVVERLLAISGRDTLTVDRKYRDPWTGQLPTRFVIISNELPRFGDASGAIANRFVVLTLTESWLGREDRGLEAELEAELPGILNWALDGLARVALHKRFTEPQSSIDAVTALVDLVSPTAAFVRDRCERGPYDVDIEAVWTAWKEWADDNGHRPGTKQSLGRDLRAAVPGLRLVRLRDGESRERAYRGLRLRESHNGDGRGPTRTWASDNGPGPHRSTDLAVVRSGAESCPDAGVSACDHCRQVRPVVRVGAYLYCAECAATKAAG